MIARHWQGKALAVLSLLLLSQDRVLAFMMGTHSRLGADSPVLMFDAHLASTIAESVTSADRW
jgi:hypothetical protein